MERIDLTRAEDPRDIVHRAVACLAKGGVVGLPTETVYILAASATCEEAVGRLTKLGDAGDVSLAVKGADELADWVPNPSNLAVKLTRRGWPGPVHFRFTHDSIPLGLAKHLPRSVRAAIGGGEESILLQSSSHMFSREIGRLVPGPLVVAEARASDGSPATLAESLADRDAGIDMLLDYGSTGSGMPATIAAIDRDSWRIERPGIVSAEQVQRMAGTIFLFICTGNTCRSPMAEAICKKRLADRLRCSVAELESRGYVVLSAGISAAYGHPAAREAMDVVQTMGASLRDHGSRPVTRELIAHADVILAMTREHRHALLSQIPEAAGRVRLLNPKGGDIPDPIGMDRDTYHKTANAIDAHITQLLNEVVAS